MRTGLIICAAVLVLISVGCGEEYFSTPEKTLQHYVKNRMMGSRQEYEAVLNSFTRDDRSWWDDHYMKLCTAMYGKDCPGEGLSTETTIWTDKFEPAGPQSDEIEKSEIDDDQGTATLTVQGQDIEFVKERGNWKIVGLFGMKEELESQYPQIR
ncbi:hypothetical protein L0244_03675 [bacterium]|nr:hypothetical protein [bacterium]